MAELDELATAAVGVDWLVTLLAALAGGAGASSKAQRVGLLTAEMVKKAVNPRRTKPVQAFVAAALDASGASSNMRRLLEEMLLAQTRQAWARRSVVIKDNLAETSSPTSFNITVGSLVAQLFDNIGYKRPGKDTTYVQYTSRLFQTW